MTRCPEPPSSLAAEHSTREDPPLEADLTRIALTRQARNSGATWATIGRTRGTSAKLAKRDAKRLTAATRRTWYLHHNQDEA